MDLNLNEEQLMLKTTVQSIVQNEFSEEYVRQLCREKKYPKELDNKLSELGLFGVCFSEKYGGAGLGFLEVGIIIEELSRYSIDLGISFGLNILGGMMIHEFGAESDKETFLPLLATGKMTFSIGYYEPFVVMDEAQITANISVNGDSVELSGKEIFSEKRDSKENHILLPVYNKNKLALLIIPEKELRYAGTVDTLGRDLLGLVKHEIGEEPIQLEKALVINDEDSLRYLEKWLKIINLVSCAGNMKTVIENTLRYSKERIQFERPIGTFQAIQHMIVDAKIKADASRMYAYWILWLIDKEKNAGNQFDLTKEINMANVYTTQSFVDAVNAGLQIMGGYGYIVESHMERYIRDARNTTYYVEQPFLQKRQISERTV